MKTIKSKILIPTLSLFIICTIILSAFTISGIYLSTMSALEESMDATVTTATQVIQNQLTAYENIAQMLTVEESLTQTLPDVNSPEYAAVRADIVLSAAILAKSQNFKFIKVLDKDGIDIESGFGVGPAEFFTIPKNEGRTYISNPIVYESTGNLEMYVTAPIIKDGEFAGVILCIIDPSVFSEIAANINIGTSGHATIINKEGTTIAYHDIEFVRNQYNAVKEYETDPSLASLVKLEQDLLAGNSGFGSYTQDGESRIMAYSPIEGTDGWGMYVTASQQEFLSQMYMSSFASLTLGVIIILVAAFVMIRLTTKIVKPAVQATQQLPAIANGDFTVELTGNGTDEIAKIVELFNDTIQKTRKSLNNMKTEAGTLEGIGNKLAEDASQAASAVHEIASNVDSIKGQVINESAGVNQIHATIGQIVNHIEGLDGEIKQQSNSIENSTAATEEMVANIRSVTSVLNENEEEVKRLSAAAEKGQEMIGTTTSITEKLSAQSDGLLEASNIIENIGAQTSLLAMNAAIEAAHAGEAGKGFSVVADEIRKLAENTGVQSKSITQVLKEAKANIENLSENAQFVETQFATIFELINNVQTKEAQVSDMMQEQAIANEQVLQSMQDIAGITKKVQNGSVQILNGSHEIRTEVEKLNEITVSINSSMDEMAQGATEIRNASQNVNDMSLATKNSIEVVKEHVDKFIV